MSVQSTLMADSSGLSETDTELLDVLAEGRATKGYLIDVTGRHRNTVGHRLEVLEAEGHIRCVHDPTALYELVADPRGEK